MNLKRVAIPVAMIALSAAVLVVYGRASTPPPASSPPPLPTVSPSLNSAPASTALPTTLPAAASQGDVPPAGSPAPEFSLPSVRGETVSLQQYRGSTNVVLLFYRTGG